MTAPSTREEIERALRCACLDKIIGANTYLAIDEVVSFVRKWRAEWLRVAEPRLRPASEKPEVGDVVCEVYPGALGCENRFATPILWRSDSQLGGNCIGWILLARAKPKTLAEEARELLGRNDARHLDNYEYQAVVRDFLRRVAEQVKRDE